MNTSHDTKKQPDGSNRGEYLTPKWLLDTLGPFDLDPCASVVRPWPVAAKHYTKTDDGLAQPWAGRVFCNPVYGRHDKAIYEGFLKRMAAHRNGILLVFARTETAAFQDLIFPLASAFLFLRGRVQFCDTNGQIAKGADGKDGSPGSPSVLVAFGGYNADILQSCAIIGSLAGKFLLNR